MKFICHRVVRSDISDGEKGWIVRPMFLNFYFSGEKKKMYFRIFSRNEIRLITRQIFFPSSILISVEI